MNLERSLRGKPMLGPWATQLLGALLVAACSGGSDGGSSMGPSEPRVVGEEDRPENGSIFVDEGGLSGTVTGERLTIEIPVRALTARSAQGKLAVSLQSVDGKRTLETTSVSYDVKGSTTRTIEAQFDVPGGVEEQADWALYNARIEGAKGIRITSSLLRVVRPYEIRLEGPKQISRAKQVSYRVVAQNPYTQVPIADLEVELGVKNDDGTVKTLKGTTGVTGDALFPLSLDEVGAFEVQAKAAAEGTEAAVAGELSVLAPERRLLLTSDKPVYQPGQTIHLRAVALKPPENTPVAKEPVLFEVEDGKGNKVFKKEIKSDEYGIAATTFVLGRVVNEGTYKLRLTMNDTTTEKTVGVSHYALPKFGLDVELDKPWYRPGDTVRGEVDARYFFGQDVSNADVTIDAYTVDVGETSFQQVVGKTDENGVMSFSVELPSHLAGLPLDQGNALAALRLTVTDTAGQEVVKEVALTVSGEGVQLAVVPESTILVPGIENRVQLFASDPLGAPVAKADVSLETGTETLTGQTDAFGIAELRFTPASGSSMQSVLTATVTPRDGKPVTETYTFGEQAGDAHVLVRTDQSVYTIGDTVSVEVLAEGESRAYVDWLNDGQAVDMRTVELEDGTATFTMPIDTSLLGSNRIEAYIVDGEGSVVRAGRTLFVRNDASLSVSLETNKETFRPGESASLTFDVADADGKPVVAALGVQVVDEAVYGLVQARPGLLQTYFQLADDFAEPQYEIHGPAVSLSDVLFRAPESPDERKAAQTLAEGAFAALGGSRITGIQVASWATVVAAAKQGLAESMNVAKKDIIAALRPVVTQAVTYVQGQGCDLNTYYCTALQKTTTEALQERVRATFEGVDFWGNRYTKPTANDWQNLLSLSSRGPDERTNTADDLALTISFDDVDLEILNQVSRGGPADFDGFPPMVGGQAPAGAGGAAAAPDPFEPESESGPSAPRVRRDFPETLYVNPAVITGADGKATLEIPLADSITEWRVSTLAHSANGQLGGGEGGIRVFQDFFTDVNFPAELTRGDEVEFPIAVYNYLDTAESVQLSLEPADWYTPLGETELEVTLAPGEVQGVRFPVRVDQVGLGKLLVRAQGSKAADAVERSVRVVPDGKRFAETRSGSLGEGSVSHTLSFPAGAVAGSEELFINVYPAFLSQVVEGMDSMLQVPNGCFEQTTSTTWPNVLATRYMEQTNQVTPEIQLRAESLISAGYQRLLTFEHPGGGFSWFGTQDPAPYLSVTAFGVMEFADMAEVHSIDPTLIERTSAWLASQQKSDGSWEGDMSEFFSFHTSAVRNTAFVTWALANAGYAGSALDAGLGYVKAELGADQDAYTLAIAANAFVSAAPNDAFTSRLIDDILAMRKSDGDKIYWDSAGTQTNFYGAGDDAAISTTALVTQALLLDGGHADVVNGALLYLTAKKDPMGNFGSTQATVWTLRALLLAASKGTESAVGSLDVLVDGKPFKTVNLTKKNGDVMTTLDLKTLATTGEHEVSLTFEGTGKVSYNLVGSHHLPWSSIPEEPQGPLAIQVDYDKTDLRVNDMVQATVNVENTTASDQNMVLVTIGLPPGFSIQTSDLDAYQADGTLSHYEITGRQIVLYVSRLGAESTASFSYHLVATMPIVAADGGAEVSLYYEPEQRAVAEARTIRVTGG